MINYSNLEQNINEFLKLEAQMVRHFLERNQIKWREGNQKTSFIYLLIDPRLSGNLPTLHEDMEKKEVWTQFLSSIFYVGKGKRSRPYDHLLDAIKLYAEENAQLATRLETRQNQINEKRLGAERAKGYKPATSGSQKQLQESKKLNRIVDIWRSQKGVVCLHIFNNIMPCEAFTREAAIIETIGISNLCNMKRGEYYGITKNLQMRQKRQLGVALLHRALHIYLAEGESQLTPFDLI